MFFFILIEQIIYVKGIDVIEEGMKELELNHKLSPKLSKTEILRAASSTIRRIHTIRYEKRAMFAVMPILLFSMLLYFFYLTPDSHLKPPKGGSLAGGAPIAHPHPNPGQNSRDTYLPSFPTAPPASVIASTHSEDNKRSNPNQYEIASLAKPRKLPRNDNPSFVIRNSSRALPKGRLHDTPIQVVTKPDGVEISWAYDGKVYDLERCASPKFDTCEVPIRVAGNMYIDNKGDSVYPIVYYRVRKIL